MQFCKFCMVLYGFVSLSTSYPFGASIPQQGSPSSIDSSNEQPMEKHPHDQRNVVIPTIVAASAAAFLRTRQILADWNSHIINQYMEELTEMQRDPEFKKCVDKRVSN